MSDAKWNSFPHLSAAQLADDDQLPVSDASQPEGEKDATTTVAALREAVAPPAPDASEVGYDNASSGLEASDVQAAVDEVVASFGQLVGVLGTAALADVGDFATAAQGSAADTAIQPGDDAADLGSGAATDGYVLTADGAGGAAWEAASGGGGGTAWGDLTGTLSDQTDLQNALNAKADASSLATVATSGDYTDLSNRPTLGSAAAANTGDFATAAQGGKADTAMQPGDELTDLASTGATAGHVPKADGSGGIAWAAESGGGGGASDFTDLGDVPSSYSGHGGKVVAVTSGEDGLEFVTGGGGGNSYYDLQLGFPGAPDAGGVDLVLTPRAVTIDDADPGSVHVGTNPTDGTATIDVQINGVSVGDFSITTGGVVTWSLAADIVLAAGDRLSLVAPSPADSTLADVIVAFRGSAS